MMKFNKIKILLFFLIVLFLGIVIFRIFFIGFYFDFLEYWILRDKIVWRENIDFIWKDFKDYENDGFFFKVGLFVRYNVNDFILFCLKIVFIFNGFYVIDIINNFNLRIIKVKFNLFEIYRRRMVRFVDSLREYKIDIYKLFDFKRLNYKFYDEFDEEWSKFLNFEKKLELLILLEEKINKVFYKKN